VDRQGRSCYGDMGDLDSQSVEELGRLVEREARSVGREGQGDSPARCLLVLDEVPLFEELSHLEEGYHAYHPYPVYHIPNLNGARPITSFSKGISLEFTPHLTPVYACAACDRCGPA
jgi:hypothetical protein